MATNRIVFTGGGTAGHVYPALAVIGALGGGFEISWIGSRTGMERGLVSEAGIRYHAIPAGKWRRYLSAENIADMLRVIGGVVAALTVLLRERPALLFSKGGYVTVPPVLAARMLRIPVITHESDTDPGLATRINSRFADLVLTSFAETVEWFPPALRPRVVTTGNPVRERFFRGDAAAGRAAAGAPEGMPIVLVLGGSLGSETVNRLVRGALPRLAGRCVVVHQTGARDYASLDQFPDYRPVAFVRDELPDLMAAADLVVARAGANTLAELAACGTPALLLPLELSGSRGDQIRNAAYFASKGAARVFEGREPRDLADEVIGLLADAQAPGGDGRGDAEPRGARCGGADRRSAARARPMRVAPLDVALGLIVATLAVRGLLRGFVGEAFAVAAVALGTLSAVLLGGRVAPAARAALRAFDLERRPRFSLALRRRVPGRRAGGRRTALGRREPLPRAARQGAGTAPRFLRGSLGRGWSPRYTEAAVAVRCPWPPAGELFRPDPAAAARGHGGILWLDDRRLMFDNIIGHRETIALLESQLAAGSFPRAVLFHGPAYSAKLSTALEAARVLCCLRGTADWSCPCALLRAAPHPHTSRPPAARLALL